MSGGAIDDFYNIRESIHSPDEPLGAQQRRFTSSSMPRSGMFPAGHDDEADSDAGSGVAGAGAGTTRLSEESSRPSGSKGSASGIGGRAISAPTRPAARAGAGGSTSAGGTGSGGGSLLTVSARTYLCQQIESLIRGLIAEVAAGRDPCFSVGLQPLFSPPFFPGARDLAGVLKVLRIVYECALQGKTVTQREVYYCCAAYFKSQQEAQASLSRLASLLGVERHELGVFAAARGKVAGLVALRPSPDSTVDLAASGSSASIPGHCVTAPPQVVDRGAEYVLVVEKDAIFTRLVEDKVWETVPCVVVTGCGMPDLATRAFVSHLHDSFPSLPVLVLCDSNPYGLGILLCYANGSKADGGRYSVPVGWLGLCKADYDHYDLPLESLQATTTADEKKAQSLLSNDPFLKEDSTSPLAAAIREELQLFLETREKMEIEGVLGRGIGFLSEVYLPDKILSRRDWVDYQ